MKRVSFWALLLTGSLLAVQQADAGWDSFRRNPWREIGRIPQNTGRALEKAVQDTGRAVEKAANDAGRAADQVFHEFCRIMTLGGSETGQASCSVSVGAGASSNGQTTEPYVYDPGNPEVRYPVGQSQFTLPSARDLEAMNRLLTPAPEMQAWEDRLNERTAVFLRPGDRIGVPWVGAASETRFPTETGVIRTGLGEFLSPRKDACYPGGRRFHGGIYYLNKVNDPVYAHVSGTVTAIFSPSEPGLLAIRIQTDGGYQGDLLCVKPSDEIRSKLERKEVVRVKAGDVVGTAQDIHMPVPVPNQPGQARPAYPLNVPQHVHATLRDPEGRFLSPDGQTTLIMKKGEIPIVNGEPSSP